LRLLLLLLLPSLRVKSATLVIIAALPVSISLVTLTPLFFGLAALLFE